MMLGNSSTSCDRNRTSIRNVKLSLPIKLGILEDQDNLDTNSWFPSPNLKLCTIASRAAVRRASDSKNIGKRTGWTGATPDSARKLPPFREKPPLRKGTRVLRAPSLRSQRSGNLRKVLTRRTEVGGDQHSVRLQISAGF